MHRYECGNCNLRSEPFVFRSGAEKRGQKHRDAKHDGMHPVNEAILACTGQMPQRSDWKVFVVFGVLILAGLISKAVGG